MNSIPMVSTWLLGTIDGVTNTQEKKISNQTKYTTLGISTTLIWLRVLNDSKFIEPYRFVAGRMAAATTVAPIVIGSVFYLGKLLGKSVKETKVYNLK